MVLWYRYSLLVRKWIEPGTETQIKYFTLSDGG
jgi:hypothetical protein